MIAALARPPLAMLLRTPRAWLPLAAWAVVGVGAALAARAGGSESGADHVMSGAFGAVVLPLLAYAVVGGVLGGRSLRGSTAGVVAFGAAPARAAAVTLAIALGASALLGAVLAAVVAAVAHGGADPPIARDAVASAYAGALGGACYASLFCLGGTLGARGLGRPVALVADWLLGSGLGPAALLTPRAHLRNLLGGPPPVELGERASGLAMLALVAVFTSLAIARSRR